jgi:hypothetical protein
LRKTQPNRERENKKYCKQQLLHDGLRNPTALGELGSNPRHSTSAWHNRNSWTKPRR